MNFQYLSIKEILRVHFQVIEDFGGSHGIRDENRLKSVESAPKQEVFGVEQYKTVYEKAAVYVRNIVGDHPFNDGNKRTAMAACSSFLMRNGFKFAVTNKELEDFAVTVATDRISVAEIANWLQNHCNNR